MPAMTPTGTPTSQTRRSSSRRRMPTVRRPRMAPNTRTAAKRFFSVLSRSLPKPVSAQAIPRQLRRMQSARAGQRLRDAVECRSGPVSAGPRRPAAPAAPAGGPPVGRADRGQIPWSFLLVPSASSGRAAASQTASAKAVQAARQAERVPVSRAPAKFVSVGGAIEFRKLHACGLQRSVQPQQGRDGRRDEIGQRLPCGDVGRAATGTSPCARRSGQGRKRRFVRLAEARRRPAGRPARRQGRCGTSAGVRPRKNADDLARQRAWARSRPRHRGCGRRRRRRSRPSSPRPARGR